MANGEEVQLGRAGRFLAAGGPEKVKLGFEPTPYANSRMEELCQLVEDLGD